MLSSTDMLVSTGILLVTYYLIFTEKIHRTSAAVIGAVVMIGAGMLLDFYSQEQAIAAIDANTIFLLAAMMMLINMLRTTGAFDYIAVRLTHISRAQPIRLLIYLSMAVSLISMLLDNVTTVIVFAPLTIMITRILNINPLPYLVAEAMLSNVGGIATLVGDPPNIMIGSAAGIDFLTFLIHMAPPVALVWVFTLSFLIFSFREELQKPISASHREHLDTRHAIRDRAELIKISIALLFVIIMFFIHHLLHLYPAYVAFAGLALAMLMVGPKPESLFREVNWSVLVFFSGLFVIVGGVEASGLLTLVGEELAEIAHDPALLLAACLVIMWVAALLSAFVDNIPFTVTMIPVILGLESSGINTLPLWWALALGVGLGGNGTHIGATANLIVVSELEKSGIPGARISPMEWMRRGLPTTLLGLTVSSLLFTLFFDYFAG
jgi:Na+/H+ antiporter NhaD/arsenite permease-like protein